MVAWVRLGAAAVPTGTVPAQAAWVWHCKLAYAHKIHTNLSVGREDPAHNKFMYIVGVLFDHSGIYTSPNV